MPAPKNFVVGDLVTAAMMNEAIHEAGEVLMQPVQTYTLVIGSGGSGGDGAGGPVGFGTGGAGGNGSATMMLPQAPPPPKPVKHAGKVGAAWLDAERLFMMAAGVPADRWWKSIELPPDAKQTYRQRLSPAGIGVIHTCHTIYRCADGLRILIFETERSFGRFFETTPERTELRFEHEDLPGTWDATKLLEVPGALLAAGVQRLAPKLPIAGTTQRTGDLRSSFGSTAGRLAPSTPPKDRSRRRIDLDDEAE